MRASYREWQARLFEVDWFARVFVRVMGELATPIYDWAFDEMEPALRAAHRIADIGCGNGLMAHRINRSVPGKDWTLLDASAAQLRAGRHVHKHIRQQSRLETVVAPAEAIPMDDNSYDLVISTGSINLWNDPELGLRECARICKPGGVLWVFDQGPCTRPREIVDALVHQRVFGVGIPGYTLEEVLEFGQRAELGRPQTVVNRTLYGLRWQL